MASNGTSSSDSGVSVQRGTWELQLRRSTAPSGEFPAQRALQSGTGFETLPPLAIKFKPFKFLKSLGLKSVGLGLAYVLFHSGWELVEWRPKLVELGVGPVEILETCDEVEEKELEVFGP